MYAILLYNIPSNFWNISEMLTERIQTITSYRYMAVTYYNKSSQWLPNTPFANTSECLVS